MLKIHRSFLSQLNDIAIEVGDLFPRRLQLSPVPNDDDELTRDVLNDPEAHDNLWQLTERPDGEQLAAFWDEVEADVQRELAAPARTAKTK